MNDDENSDMGKLEKAELLFERLDPRPASEKPASELDGAEYLLFAEWLPKDERGEEYGPDFFIALWEDGKWWIRCGGYIEYEDLVNEDGHTLRPRFFHPLPEWYDVIFWAPLFGA